MSDSSILIYVILWFLGIFLFVGFVVSIAESANEKRQQSKRTVTVNLPQIWGPQDFPYVAKDSIMTKRESYFYGNLIKAVHGKHVSVCPKVRIADIFSVEKKAMMLQRDWWKCFAAIAEKHVDFLITTHDGKVLSAIELDDSSHRQGTAKKNDTFKDSLFRLSGIPLLRFENDLSIACIKNKLDPILTEKL